MAWGECTPEQIAACPLTEHRSNQHHLYHPRRSFRSAIEKAFRDLPENKIQICERQHREIHANEEPPAKPEAQFMLDAIARARELGK